MKKLLIILILGLILISGCNTQTPFQKESPEIAAERFARYWEQKDWNSMYDMLIPELQAMKSKEKFFEIMNFLETADIVTIRLDKISDDKGKSYAYFTATTGLYESKLPAFEMMNINDKWKFNAFATYFENPVVIYKIIEHISSYTGEDMYVLISPEDKSKENADLISLKVQKKLQIEEICKIRSCSINIYTDEKTLQKAVAQKKEEIREWEIAGRMLIPGIG